MWVCFCLYGTRLGSVLQLLQLLERLLQPRRVVVLRFEGEATMPTASLLVRASQPCAQGPTSQDAWRKDFESGSFSTAALNTWLQEVASAPRVPPLWSRLTEAKESLQAENVFALILCAQTSSTETVPEALAVAARSLCASAQCAGGDVATAKVPYLSAVTFGSDFNSERLAALEELSAWSGGLSFNVAEPGMLRPAAEGLAAHLFTQGDASGFLERRRYYAQKQELGTCFMELPKMVKYDEGEATPSLTPLHLHRKTLAGLPALLLKASAQPIDFAVPSESMLTVLSDVTLVLAHRWSRSLRTWRIRRGMRDLVFGEPGSIGLVLLAELRSSFVGWHNAPRTSSACAETPMPRLWTKIANTANWLCTPDSEESKAKHNPMVSAFKEEHEEPKWSPRMKSESDASARDEMEALFAADRLEIAKAYNALKDQVLQLQSALEEARFKLHQEQMVSAEFKAQLAEETRRRETQEEELKEKFDLQQIEIEQLRAEVEKAEAVLHRQTEQLSREQETRTKCEKELIGALLDHATMQQTAQKELTTLQKLRRELEVARTMVSEEQEVSDELRRQLHREEQFTACRRASLLREHKRYKAFEADVKNFLRQLDKRLPSIARDLAITFADPPTPYGGA
eukprot:s821_g5.t4